MNVSHLAGRVLLPLVSAGLLLSAIPAAHATSTPTNDNFADATVLGPLSESIGGSDFWATPEAGEPAILGHAPSGSLWYAFTPTKTGRVVFSTQGSAFDTLLAAYTGSTVGALTQVAANDDATFDGVLTHQSEIAFTATAGKTYHVKIDSYSPQDEGDVTISVTTNDSFSAAEPLSGVWNGAESGLRGTTEGATRESGESPIAAQPGVGSVWFNWTAPFTGNADFNTFDSGFDTLLGVYTGSAVNSLQLVGSSNDYGPSSYSRVVFAAKKGQLYRIALDGVVTPASIGRGAYFLRYSETSAVNVAGGSVTEGNSGTQSLPFTFTLSNPSQQTQTLDYKTADGTAKAGSDYVAQNGSLTFAPGQTSKTVNVLVKGDTVKESDETVVMQYEITGGSTATYGNLTANGTIKNDD